MSYFTSDWIYANGQLLNEHYFYVQDGIIQEVAHLRQLNPRAFRDMVAFEDALIIPGLVNAHTHSIQSLQKGVLDDTAPHQSQQLDLTLYEPDDYYLAALYTYSQFLRQGITTVCDYVQVTAADDAIIQAHVKAAETLGLRVVLARVMADQNPEAVHKHESIDAVEASQAYQWGLPSQHCVTESTQAALDHTAELMNQFRKHELVRIIPAPYGVLHSSAKLLKGAAKLAESTQKVFQLQVAQTRAERDWCLTHYGTTPIQYLNQLGVLSRRSVCIHGLWLDDTDIHVLTQSGASIVDTPSNNLAYGHGQLRLNALLKAGVPVLFGTGGAWRNGKSSILEEMRMACLTQGLLTQSLLTQGVTPQEPLAGKPSVEKLTAEQAFLAGSKEAGKSMNLAVGAIAPGNKADFSVVDLNDLSMQPNPAQQAIRHLVYSIRPSAINAVYVGGQRLFDTGDLLSVSEADLVEQLRQKQFAFV